MSVPDLDSLLARLQSGRINRYHIDLGRGVFQADPQIPGDHEAMLEALDHLQQAGIAALGAPIPNLRVPNGSPLPVGAMTGSSELLSETIELFVQDLLDRTKNRKTGDDFRRTLKLFEKLTGNKRTVESTHADVARFDEHTRKQGLAPKTAEKRLTTLHTFFGWAQVHSRYPQDLPLPTSNISKLIRRQHTKQQSRQRFSPNELERIFNPETYLERNSRRPDWFWSPMLGLYEGPRIEELIQLRTSDVMWDPQSKCFYLDINDRDGKSIKNRNSIRRVPIHPQLVQLGFLDYVDDVRRCGYSNDRLFPYLTPNKYGIYSSSVSKHFSWYLRKIKIMDPSRVFHSFRHTVATQLRDRGVAVDIRHRLLGHALNEGEQATYLHGDIPLATLFHEGIERLSYECVESSSSKPLNLNALKYEPGKFVPILRAMMK